MSLIVRDEIELISANIAFHASQGVDTFWVMDNGSTDGTREKLDELKQDYDIVVFDQTDDSFEQRVWATTLALMARQSGKADYIISNDADEFWFSKTGSLKDQCRQRSPVVAAPRTNMLPLADQIQRPDYRFYHNVLSVVAPPEIGEITTDPTAAVPMMLRRMPAKILCSLTGLHEVETGNHSVKHEAGRPATSEDLRVYHFPVRSFEQFAKHVEFAKKRFARELLSSNKGSSWHKRRWVAQMELGLLKNEWTSFLLDAKQAATLEAAGVIRRDETIRHFFEQDGETRYHFRTHSK